MLIYFKRFFIHSMIHGASISKLHNCKYIFFFTCFFFFFSGSRQQKGGIPQISRKGWCFRCTNERYDKIINFLLVFPIIQQNWPLDQRPSQTSKFSSRHCNKMEIIINVYIRSNSFKIVLFLKISVKNEILIWTYLQLICISIYFI